MTDATVTDINDKRRRKPKPTKNPDAGEVACPFCRHPAPVRKNANQKLYFNCARCGIVQPALPAFQEWLLEHATLYGPEGKPEPVTPVKQPEPDTRDDPKMKIEKKPGAEVAGRVEIVAPAASPAAVAPAKPAETAKPRKLSIFK